MWITQQTDNGDQKLLAQGGGSETSEAITEWATGVDAGLGRGVVNAARSYLRLRRTDGTIVYIYVDTGTTVACSTTRP